MCVAAEDVSELCVFFLEPKFCSYFWRAAKNLILFLFICVCFFLSFCFFEKAKANRTTRVRRHSKSES